MWLWCRKDIRTSHRCTRAKNSENKIKLRKEAFGNSRSSWVHSMIKKTGIIFFAILFAMLTIMVGCNGKDKDSDAPTTTSSSQETQESEVNGENSSNGADGSGQVGDGTGQDGSGTDETAVKRDRDTLEFSLIGTVDSLDPGWTTGALSAQILANLGEGLVRYDNNGNLVPGVADHWEISENATVYTFTLKDGLQWSDGSALTAQDFEYAWERVLNQDFGSHAAHTMYPYIKNAEDYFSGDAAWEDVGIKASDRLTLEVTLSSATPQILPLMATCTYYPVNRAATGVATTPGSRVADRATDTDGTADETADEADSESTTGTAGLSGTGGAAGSEGSGTTTAAMAGNGISTAANENWATNPETFIGNGAFVLDEYTEGVRISLKKNEHYRNADAVSLSKIVYNLTTIPQTALTAFVNGEVDGVGGIPPGTANKLPKDSDAIHLIPAFSTTYALFNTKESALFDPRVRKALSLVLDRTALVETILTKAASNDSASTGTEVIQSGSTQETTDSFGENGVLTYLTPATSYVAPGFIIGGRDFSVTGASADLSTTAILNDAKILMAEAGYPNGAGFPELEIIYYTDALGQSTAETIRQQWLEHLGINLLVTGLEWSGFSERIQIPEYDICLLTDIGEFLHPTAFLKNFSLTNNTVQTTWNSSEFKDLLKEIQTETDNTVLNEKMHQAQSLLLSDHVIAPLYHRSVPMLMDPSVKNWYVTANQYALFEQITKD